MNPSLYNLIYDLGQHSMEHIWFPVLIWTLFSSVVYLALKYTRQLDPLYHYHLRAATIVALPVGILASVLLQHGFSGLNDSAAINTALIIVSNPIQAVPITSSVGTGASFSFLEPSLMIGMVSILLLVVGVLLVFRLLYDLHNFRKLTQGLKLQPLEDFGKRSDDYSASPIMISFHNNPYVPFTYGWRTPIVVLPERLKEHPDKLAMALEHELVHIQRKDYLLQMVLTVMEMIFWFHPLVRITSNEIDIYREISCDQQVLNETGYSVKSYANLLFELLPLNTGTGRLSVSMAVKQSTLKQRIKTMKTHKLHRSSMRQSVLFLMLMVFGITFPIACSEMRGPELLDRATLEQATLQHKGAVIEINGKEVVDLTTQSAASTNGTGSLYFNAQEFGSFMIALQPFPGAERNGQVENNEASFRINSMDVKIRSEIPFITNLDRADIWVAHSTLKSRVSHGTSGLMNIDTYINGQGSSGSVASSGEEDFFVVVEEMPKLIGGIKSISSKIQYPESARRAGIEGRVIVQFIVNKNGDVEDAEVVRGIGGGADEEALRVIRDAKFEPGVQRGRPVRVQFSMPVVFKLSDADFGSTADTQ
ncbi:TonB family protein [Balneola sp. MJW-20]|uniref:TonB family protein n=1 Tax=Gracilimonas aurantiaca TaxID=3234185 RepID=UPI00390A5477